MHKQREKESYFTSGSPECRLEKEAFECINERKPLKPSLKIQIPNLIYAKESNENQKEHSNLTLPFIWKTRVLLSPPLDGL